jgi:hypothetical protein
MVHTHILRELSSSEMDDYFSHQLVFTRVCMNHWTCSLTMHAEMLNRTTEEEGKTMSIPQQRVYNVVFVVTHCWSESGRFIFYYY